MFVLSGRMFISHPTTIKTESIMIMDFFFCFVLFVFVGVLQPSQQRGHVELVS